MSESSKPERMAEYLEAVCAPILPPEDRAELRVEWRRAAGVYEFVIIAPAESGGRLVGVRGVIARGIRAVAGAFAGAELGWGRNAYNVNVKRTIDTA